jgi:hypothetical protein
MSKPHTHPRPPAYVKHTLDVSHGETGTEANASGDGRDRYELGRHRAFLQQRVRGLEQGESTQSVDLK